MEELRVRKYTLGPKGFKIIIKSKCQEDCGRCLQMRGWGGLLTAGPPLPLVVDLHANSDVKGEPPLKLFFYTKSKISGKKITEYLKWGS